MTEPDHALRIHREERRQPPELDPIPLLPQKAEERACRIGDAPEGQVLPVEMALKCLPRIRADDKGAQALVAKRWVPVTEPHELPSAVRSPESPEKEDQDRGHLAHVLVRQRPSLEILGPKGGEPTEVTSSAVPDQDPPPNQEFAPVGLGFARRTASTQKSSPGGGFSLQPIPGS